MSDKKINPEHLYNTLAGKLARELDAMDGKKDNQIDAKVWNVFVSDKGGKEIKESIDVYRAMGSITVYCCREGANDGGKTGTEKAKEWEVGLDELVIGGQNSEAEEVIEEIVEEVEDPKQGQYDNSAKKEDTSDSIVLDNSEQGQIVIVPSVIPSDNTDIPKVERPLQPADTTKVQTPRERSRKIDNNEDGTQTITRLDKNGNVKKSRVALSWKDIGKTGKTSVKDFFKGMVCDDDGKVNGWKVAGAVATVVAMGALTVTVGAAASAVVATAGAGTALAGLSTAAGAAASFATLATGVMLLKPLIEGGTEKTIKGAQAYYTAQSKEEAEQGMKEQMDGIVELASVPVLGRIFKGIGKGLNKLGFKNTTGKGRNKVKPEQTKPAESKPAEPKGTGETPAEPKAGAEPAPTSETPAPTAETPEVPKPETPAAETPDAGKASAGGETPKTETQAENKTTTKTNMFGVTKVRDANGKLISKTYRKHGLKVTDEYEYVNNEKNLKKRHIWSDINENQIFKTEEYRFEGHNRVVTTTEYKYDADGNQLVDNVVKDTFWPNSNKLLKREGTTEKGTYTVDYDINEIPTKATGELKNGPKYIETEYKDGHFTKRRIEHPDGRVEEHVYTLTDEGVYDWVNAKDGSPIETVSVESGTGKPEGAVAGKPEDANAGKPEDANAGKPEDANASKAPAGDETPKTETPAENKPKVKKNIFGVKKVFDAEGNVIKKTRKTLFRGEITKKYKGKDLITKRRTYKDMFGHKFTEEYDYTSGKKVLKKKTFWEHSNEKQISSTEEYNMDGENKVVTTTKYYAGKPCNTYTDTYKPNSSKPFKRVGQSDNEAYTIEYDENGFPTKRTGKKFSDGNVVDDYTETYRPNSNKLYERIGKKEDGQYKVEYNENDIPIKYTFTYDNGSTEVYTDYIPEISAYAKCVTTEANGGKTTYYELTQDANGKYFMQEVEGLPAKN